MKRTKLGGTVYVFLDALQRSVLFCCWDYYRGRCGIMFCRITRLGFFLLALVMFPSPPFSGLFAASCLGLSPRLHVYIKYVILSLSLVLNCSCFFCLFVSVFASIYGAWRKDLDDFWVCTRSIQRFSCGLNLFHGVANLVAYIKDVLVFILQYSSSFH